MSEFLLILVPKEPRVSKEVFLKVADIFLNLGNLCVGSIILPFILETPNTRGVIGGILFAMVSWLLALMIVQKYHN